MKKETLLKIERVKKSTDFIGLKTNGKNFTIYVPSFFRESKDDYVFQKDILLLLKSIAISKSMITDEIKTSRRNLEKDIMPIDSYLWILNDYLQNGIFYDREKQYYSGYNGRIDWKKTIKNVPILSNGNIIYDKVVSSKMAPTNDVISQIYKICVQQSQFYIGWLFDVNFPIHLDIHSSTKEMTHYVLSKLKGTFDDNKRLRFVHMLKILNFIEGESSASTLKEYGVENYYYSYEVMVDKLFKGISQEERKKYNPMGYWNLEGSEDTKSSDLRPDTIHIKNDELYIIDAKMYQYGTTKLVKDLPATSSMQKQITYGDYVLKITDGHYKIRNAFILPYNKSLTIFQSDKYLKKYLDDNLVYIGEASVAWKDRDNPRDHDRIFTFLIDFNFLLRSYNKENSEYIDTLCKEIKEKLKNKKVKQ